MVIDKLRKRVDFKRLTTGGRVIKSRSFILQYAPLPDNLSKGIPLIRYGLTVTKKVGNAVQRNRLKRRLRALIMSTFPHTALPFYDYVFIGRKFALHQDFDLLKEEIIKALKNIKHKATTHESDF